MLNAINGRLSLPTGELDYIRFGRGERTLVMIPGVGDGLKTVKGMALPFALLYRALARDFTVYVFSRGVTLPQGMTTRDMAAELNTAMDALGLRQAAVVGVSQGGMIAQWLAIEHPDKVARLVLTVTCARANDTLRESLALWMAQARRGDYRGLMRDTAERSYSPKRVRQARLTYGLLGNLGKPESFERFLIQAASCLRHDTWARLGEIACPTLVIGGTEDRVLSGRASQELAEQITGSKLVLYRGLSHGLYEEAPDYLRLLADFCR